MKTQKIALVGGPGTGKTAVINRLMDLDYYCFEEISRQVTLEAQQKGITQLFLKDPLLFSQKLIKGRISQFEKSDRISVPVCFFDRGIPEVSAYMDYKNQIIPLDFEEAHKKYKYDFVFFFPFWENIYDADNERYETVSEAKEIGEVIKKTYQNLNYDIIEVPKTSLDKRIQFILDHIYV